MDVSRNCRVRLDTGFLRSMKYLRTITFGDSFTIVAVTPLEHVNLGKLCGNVSIEIVDEMEHNSAWDTGGKLHVHVAQLCIELDDELYVWKEWDLR